MRLQGLGKHIPQVSWLEQFTHEKNLFLPRMENSFEEKAFLEMQTQINPFSPAQGSSNLFVIALLKSEMRKMSTEQSKKPESSVLALLIPGTFKTELTQLNFSDSRVLLGNFK